MAPLVTLIALFVTLLVPVTGHAAVPVACVDTLNYAMCQRPYPAPTDFEVCQTPPPVSIAPKCVTTATTDTITFVEGAQTSGSIVGGEVYRGNAIGRTAAVWCIPVTWTYKKFHPFRKGTPYFTATIATCSITEGGYTVNSVFVPASPALVVTRATYSATAESPDCSLSGENGSLFYRYSVPSATSSTKPHVTFTNEATATAPQQFVDDCKLVKHVGGAPAPVPLPLADTTVPTKFCTSTNTTCVVPAPGEVPKVTDLTKQFSCGPSSSSTTGIVDSATGQLAKECTSACAITYRADAFPPTPATGSCAQATGRWERIAYYRYHQFNTQPYLTASIKRFVLPDGRASYLTSSKALAYHGTEDGPDCSMMRWSGYGTSATLSGTTSSTPEHVALCRSQMTPPSAPPPTPTKPRPTSPVPSPPTTNPTGSTPTAPLPQLYNGTPTSGGRLERRPTTFEEYSGSGMGFRSLSWTEWSATRAAGTGVFYAKKCEPSCAAAVSTEHPFTITLGGLRTCSKGVEVFTSATLRAVKAADESLIELLSPLTFECPPAPVVAKPRPTAATKFTNALASKWVSRLTRKRGATNGATVSCRGATSRGNRARCSARYYVGDGFYKMTVTISLTRDANRRVTSVSGRASGRMLDEYACQVTKTSCAWTRARWADRIRP